MIKNRQIRIDDETFEEFQKLANKEGRFLGKMIEVLVKSYKRENGITKTQEEEKPVQQVEIPKPQKIEIPPSQKPVILADLVQKKKIAEQMEIQKQVETTQEEANIGIKSTLTRILGKQGITELEDETEE